MAWGSKGRAADLNASETDVSVEVHGFVSQGFIKSTGGNNYLADSARDGGSLEFTEVGLNFTSQLTERLRVGMQLFARDLGPVGTYSAKMDWFYLDYRWRDWLGLRAGRVKLPYGLYNELADIDSARVPILLPQSLYPSASRDYLLAQTGMELYGYLSLHAGGALDYRLYLGTIYVDIPSQAGSPIQVSRVKSPYIGGGRLIWETPLEGLRVGGSVQALRLNFNFVTSPGMMDTNSFSAVLWATSAEYAWRDLLLSAEYGRWYVHDESSNPLLLQPDAVSERMYVMASYRLRPWFQPGAYYSVFFPHVSWRDNTFQVSAREDVQHDYAATLRFDINTHLLVKVEGHYMHGTAGLDSGLNGGTAAAQLTQDWLVGLVKLTAYF
ncbi:MAG: hypothetical protein ABIS92_14485 [Polyangia bacterium]